MKTLDELSKWYQSQCNGDWEHLAGVKIESTDNPGWWIKINLVGTPVESREFATVSIGVDKERNPQAEKWIHCSAENGEFNGAGDAARLEEIVRIFLDWANS
jgi:hypothetical protein